MLWQFGVSMKFGVTSNIRLCLMMSLFREMNVILLDGRQQRFAQQTTLSVSELKMSLFLNDKWVLKYCRFYTD